MSRDRSDVEQVTRSLAARGIESLLSSLGLLSDSRREGSGFKTRCPFHAERSGSLQLRIASDGTIAAHCFGCEKNADAVGFIAAVLGLDARTDFPQVLEEAARIAGVNLEGAERPHRKTAAPTRAPVPALPPSPARTYPPRAEVLDVWAAAGRVSDDAQVRRELLERAIDPAHVTDRDDARVLVGGRSLPSWARFGGKPWDTIDRRLLVPMRDATGQIVTLHARRLSRLDDGMPKGLSPAGYTHAGAVFADPLGRMILSSGKAPDWCSQCSIIIAEGVPDFLTWATHYGDDESAPAVLGVISGSWSAALAARIPDDARVTIRTHGDDAGIKYGVGIATSLRHRCDVLASPAVAAVVEVQR